MTYLVPPPQEAAEIKTGAGAVPAPMILCVNVLVDGLMTDSVDTELERQPSCYLFGRKALLQVVLHIGTDEGILETGSLPSGHDPVMSLLVCHPREVQTSL